MEKPIALGRTAEIYEWHGGQVLKLYYDWFELDNIRFEQRMAQAVHASGLPVPAVGELIQIEGRNGLIYERVDGVAMWEMLQRRPGRLFRYARQWAELQVEMHSVHILPDIPSQRQRLERKINRANQLSEQLKQVALNTLAALPDGDRLCHGDFHPGNILLTSERAVIIDWIDASRGNPLADVARSTIIALGAAASSQIPNPLMKLVVRLFHSIYLRRYFQLCPGTEKEYRRWIPVVAAARLEENMPELEKWLIGRIGRLV